MNLISQTSEAGVGVCRLIYVVDDERLLLDLARYLLEAEGFEVKTFRDPSQALQAYRRARRKPGLILTDYQMRSMNGLELTSAFRRLTPDVKVALLSGSVDSAVYETASDQPDRFLSKPYGQRELVQMVHDLLD